MIDIPALPKAELHVHIEGTLEPQLIFELAERNKIPLAFSSVEALDDAYRFADLQSFLNVYYEGMKVLRSEQDFCDLTLAYMRRVQQQSVKHTEIFFDPQMHMLHGVAFETVVEGISAALSRAGEYGMSAALIMCFLRDLPAQSAMQTLELALPYAGRIVAVGLDSAEIGNPPSKFTEVFQRARAEGFLAVAHAGEEGPPAYVWEALDLLKASRIDHGVRSLEDARLVETLRQRQVPLTVCPLSNVRLGVVKRLSDHPLKQMLEAGLRATVNSDDPAYFSGYIDDNYREAALALGLSNAELIALAKNSFLASFLDDAAKQRHLSAIDALAVSTG
jgi:adenosine deaminase